jgi:hypothetical protein
MQLLEAPPLCLMILRGAAQAANTEMSRLIANIPMSIQDNAAAPHPKAVRSA